MKTWLRSLGISLAFATTLFISGEVIFEAVRLLFGGRDADAILHILFFSLLICIALSITIYQIDRIKKRRRRLYCSRDMLSHTKLVRQTASVNKISYVEALELESLFSKGSNSAPPDDTTEVSLFSLLLVLTVVLLVTLSIPIIFYSFLHPGMYKKAIQIVTFIISVISAAIFYSKNRQQFPKIVDKVTFFSGVCLGPLAALEVFL